MSLQQTFDSKDPYARNARLMPRAEIQAPEEQNSLTLLRSVLHPSSQNVSRPRLPSELLEAANYRIGLIPVDDLRQVPGSTQAALRSTNSVIVRKRPLVAVWTDR